MTQRQNTKYRSVIKAAHSVRSFSQQIASKLGISISKLNLKSLLANGSQGQGATDEQIPHDPKSNYVEPVVIIPFSTSLSSANTRANIAVVFHAFNVDQAADFLKYFQNIPVPFSLFISTDTAQKATKLRKVFDKGPAARIEVRVLPNRGRDIAPKLLGFADVHHKHDLVLHLHTKVSIHDSSLQGWRDFILDSLLGSREAVRSILEAFDHSPQLGMIAPRHISTLRPNMNWDGNFDGAARLAKRMGLTLFPDSPVDFPSGSMFWARSAALQPLFDANLTLEDFPEEAGQTGGTIAHSIERLFFYSSELAGLRWMRVARTEKLIAPEQPLYIHSKVNLDWAMSDQMPSLLLPGVRPRPTQSNVAPAPSAWIADWLLVVRQHDHGNLLEIVDGLDVVGRAPHVDHLVLEIGRARAAVGRGHFDLELRDDLAHDALFLELHRRLVVLHRQSHVLDDHGAAST